MRFLGKVSPLEIVKRLGKKKEEEEETTTYTEEFKNVLMCKSGSQNPLHI